MIVLETKNRNLHKFCRKLQVYRYMILIYLLIPILVFNINKFTEQYLWVYLQNS